MSDACRSTVIVFHDSANEEVRAGLEAVRFAEHPEAAFALLDFVPGYVAEVSPRHFEVWCGLALVVLREGRSGPPVDRVIRQLADRRMPRSPYAPGTGS